ncbi:MAG TPA: SprT-like domain-containing protein [Nannocystis sp.]
MTSRSQAPALRLVTATPAPEAADGSSGPEGEGDAGADDDGDEALQAAAAQAAMGTLEPGLEDALRQWLQRRLSAYLKAGRARIIFTDNVHTMLSVKRGQGVYTLRMHRMFAAAPPAVLRAVARYAQSQDREAAALLRRYIDGNEHLIRTADRPRAQQLDTQGAHFNLQELFDGLNARYFGGKIEARITWGPRTRRKPGRESIKLGSYSIEERLIRVHPVLDAADVPRFFVEWIIYHEMLHEVHDMPIVDGRRVYHTPEFRRAEALFEHYAEAVLWERTQVHKLLDR